MIKSVCLWIGVVVFGILSHDVIGEIPFWVNIKSGALVLAGTLIGGMLSVPVTTFRQFFHHIFSSLKRNDRSLDGLIEQITEFARLHRVAGIRELSVWIRAVENSYLRRGLQQVLDLRDRQKIEDTMVKEITLSLSRLHSHLATLNNFTRLAPVFGFVGTIIGLINVLNHMGDASQIGHGMAISLLTTFYGLLLANFIFGPLTSKLATYIHGETLRFNIIIEGVLAICDDRNSLEVSHNLRSYIELNDDSTNPAPSKPYRFGRKWGVTLKQNGLAR